MRPINPPRPVPRQVAHQRLGLADTGEGIAGGGFDQGVDALQGFLVLALQWM